MELVYPIYLDTPMMTAFLASLEGGLLEETTFESKLADAQESARTGAFSIKVANLLSNLVAPEARAELAKKVSESLEAHYKSNLRFPNASLFIRLRELLLDQEAIKVSKSAEQIGEVSVGDLVEFNGAAIPGPAYQIRRAFAQMLPIIGPINDVQIAQLDQTLATLGNAVIGQPIKIGKDTSTPSNPQDLKAVKGMIAAQQAKMRAEASMYQAMGDVFTNLFPQDNLETILFRGQDFQAVARIYPALVRDERIQDIYDANWHCLGKVIATLSEAEEYDLLKGSVISYMAKDQFPSLTNILNNEDINVQTTEPKVKGPALVLATLAIFA
jgi:hypothetical protein